MSYGHVCLRVGTHACVWQVLLRELPLLLSELRDEDIALGALRSLPLSPAQVWKTAVEEAMETAAMEVQGKSSEATEDASLLLL